MVNFEKFWIELNKTNLVYSPGDKVSGRLHITSKEREKINNISIQFKGNALVIWKSGKQFNTGLTNYLDELKIVKEGEGLYIEPGSYSYPFEFTLPSSLPTSFEADYGRIRYWVQGTIGIPWSITNENTFRSFTVINKLDLNSKPELRQAYGLTDRKIVCCGPCKSNPIDIDLSVPKSNYNCIWVYFWGEIINSDNLKAGYVAGESVKFNVNINNRSWYKVTAMDVALVQRINFKTGSRKKCVEQTLVQHKLLGPIEPQTQQNWTNKEIKIPAVCPSLLDTCSCIDNAYFLKFTMKASGLSVKRVLSIPIVVGTVHLDTSDSLPKCIYMKSVISKNGVSSSQDYSEEEKIINGAFKFGFKCYNPLYPCFIDDFYESKPSF